MQLEADSLCWCDPTPPTTAPINPEPWDEGLLKALARLCRRGTRLRADRDSPELREGLQRLGFVLSSDTPGLQARYLPAWEPRRSPPLVAPWPQDAARDAVVIGGGLSGLGTAHALARRGWQVTVLDACTEPAGGASGLPAGLFSPHVSPDDNRISRLTRTGLRITRQTALRLLAEQQDWTPSGVLEHRVHGKAGPRADADGEATGSEEASAALKQAAGRLALDPPAPNRFRYGRARLPAIPGRVTVRAAVRLFDHRVDHARGFGLAHIGVAGNGIDKIAFVHSSSAPCAASPRDEWPGALHEVGARHPVRCHHAAGPLAGVPVIQGARPLPQPQTP